MGSIRWRLRVIGVLLWAVMSMPAACSTPGHRASADTLIEWYREVISPVDGDRCPMHPSCSLYAQEAFSRHGWFLGWILTSERLMRCGHDEIHLAEPIWTIDGLRYVDPLSSNDFWWTERKAP
ncbi:MAG: membrane protein insertion efficiency factor YidD [Thermodesulfobacteriota bacterium]